jgi:hypothetical protein
MTATLHLGVNKWLNGEAASIEDESRAGVFAEIIPIGRRGRAIQTLVPIGPNGPTRSIEVPAGKLSVQVRLPSGEVLVDEVFIANGRAETLVLQSQRSPHEWMSWPRFVSERAWQSSQGRRRDIPILDLSLWTRNSEGKFLARDKAPWLRETDAERGLLSITFQSNEFREWFGQRQFLEIRTPGRDEVVLAPLPLPWAVYGPNVPVQVLVTLPQLSASNASADVDVIVHDHWLTPMLAYLHSGDLAAARFFQPSVLGNAELMLRDKVSNPVAAAAGGYLLLRTRALAQLHDWPHNLAQWFAWLPDGAIIEGTQLLRTGGRKAQRRAVLDCFVKAASRGAPVFAEGVRLLADGVRMLGTWKSNASARATRTRNDDRYERLVAWVDRLEAATRPDSLFATLEADEVTLKALVEGVQPNNKGEPHAHRAASS